MRLRQAVDTPLVHLALFVATGLSVAATHFVVFNGGVPGDDFADRAQGAGLFAGCIMLILGAHEMGHWLLSRHHRVDASLPWFIPLPLLGFGTLGAVIRLRGRIPTRNALIDIGAAGPLAGLAIAVPLMISGLLLSHVEAVPLAEARTLPALSGLALLQDLGSWALPNLVPAAPAAVGIQLYGESLLTLVLERLVVGPVPPGHDIFVHPVFLAAWFGLLVTMLNLLPVGQLDGGHVSHALFGARAERLGRWVARGLLVLALTSSVSWLAWFLVVTRVVRFGHPPVIAPEVPVDGLRTAVAWVSLALALLLFMPAPMGLL